MTGMYFAVQSHAWQQLHDKQSQAGHMDTKASAACTFGVCMACLKCSTCIAEDCPLQLALLSVEGA